MLGNLSFSELKNNELGVIKWMDLTSMVTASILHQINNTVSLRNDANMNIILNAGDKSHLNQWK